MITLHIEGARHAFGGGEAGWIEEDEPVATAPGRRVQPRQTVGLYVAVLCTDKAIQCHVSPRPVEIGGGHVYRGGRGRTATRGIDRGGAGLGKQVQEVSVTGELGQQAARDAVVEEQAGVEIVLEVHQ